MTRARGLAFAFALGGLGATSAWARPARAADPYLDWYTVKSPHFRVHYAAGLEDIAQRTTSSAEAVYRRLVPQLGFAPKQVTEIVVTDDTDLANGSAVTIPYNTVRLFATAPDDMSPPRRLRQLDQRARHPRVHAHPADRQYVGAARAGQLAAGQGLTRPINRSRAGSWRASRW